MAAVQHSRSNVAVPSMCPVKTTNTETAAAQVARRSARREPPSSRAIRPVSTTTAPAASAEGIRRTVSESGTEVAARATSGVSGPWSTYAQSRWRAAARKYSSSRCGP